MNSSSAMMSDLTTRFWHALALPDRAMLGVKIARKTLTDNAALTQADKALLLDFYRDLIVRVTKLEASSWTGNYRTGPHQKDDDATLVQRLSELKALQVALNALHNQSSKTVQMNKKIKLNLQAQELKRKITALKATL